MREKLLKLAQDLDVGIKVVHDLPENWFGGYLAIENQVELHPEACDGVLLHELCHALQFLGDAQIWDEWVDDDDKTGELELDCELRAIGWLYLNGFEDEIETFIIRANDNLENYGLRID